MYFSTYTIRIYSPVVIHSGDLYSQLAQSLPNSSIVSANFASIFFNSDQFPEHSHANVAPPFVLFCLSRDNTVHTRCRQTIDGHLCGLWRT